MSDLSRFDADPDALAWARGKVQRLADRYCEFGRHCTERGDREKAAQWRKFASLLELELIGGKTCVITPFDERRPRLRAQLDAVTGEAPPAAAASAADGTDDEPPADVDIGTAYEAALRICGRARDRDGMTAAEDARELLAMCGLVGPPVKGRTPAGCLTTTVSYERP